MSWWSSRHYRPLSTGKHEIAIDAERYEDYSSGSRTWTQIVKNFRQSRLVVLLVAMNFAYTILMSNNFAKVADDITLPTLTMHNSNETRDIFKSYIGDVNSYLHDHPHMEPADTTFAQIGLFTRLYARLIQDNSAGNDLINAFERNLWFFAPGLQKVRERHIATSNGYGIKTKSHKATRGIVLPVGTGNFDYAIHFIASIRNVHLSEMPIEIIYRDENDLPMQLRTYLANTYSNIVLTSIEKSNIFNQTIAEMSGWSIKPFAIVASTFDEILLADADSVLLASPETFFQQSDYKSTGTLFFSDRNAPRVNLDIRNWLLRQFGVNGNGPSESLANSFFWQKSVIFRQESGVMVLDKTRPQVFASLLFAAWQNLKEIREKATYRLFWGDKESFWLSFELARFPYYINNHGAGNLGSEPIKAGEPFCGEHPLHFFEVDDMQVNILQSNRTRPLISPAWMNGSLRKNKNAKDSRELLDPKSTIWTMDGLVSWDYDRAWCQHDYTRHTTNEYNLEAILSRLKEAATIAETAAQRYLHPA